METQGNTKEQAQCGEAPVKTVSAGSSEICFRHQKFITNPLLTAARVVVALIVCAACSCSAAGEDGVDPRTDTAEPDAGGGLADEGGAAAPSFAVDVHPILLVACADCHATEAPITPYRGPGDFGSVDVEFSYTEAMRYVVVSDPAASRLWVAVDGTGAYPMPPFPATLMPEDTQTVIREWIAGGAQP